MSFAERGSQPKPKPKNHAPFAKTAKSGAPAKTGAGFGRVVEWYHSRGGARNCGDYEWKLRKGGHPPQDLWRNRATPPMRLTSRVSHCLLQAPGSQKATIAVAALFALLVIGFWLTDRLAKTVPGRPKDVPADAVFLWAPAVGFPGVLPRRGSWLACVEDQGQDRCSL